VVHIKKLIILMWFHKFCSKICKWCIYLSQFHRLCWVCQRARLSWKVILSFECISLRYLVSIPFQNFSYLLPLKSCYVWLAIYLRLIYALDALFAHFSIKIHWNLVATFSKVTFQDEKFYLW